MSAPITLDGRCGRDPEMKTSSSGKALTRVSVVTNGRRKTETGWEDTDTTWWDVTFFGATAEAVADQVKKGDRVIITGRVRDEKWTGPDGAERSKKAVIGDGFGVRRRMDSNATTHEPAGDPWAAEAPF